MDNKQKHLEFIQAVITRMAGNLFLLKGWAVTLIVALFAIMANQMNPAYFLFSFCILFIFWVLDGYFLSMERCFRGLYNEVRLKKEEDIDFSMNFMKHNEGKNTWLRSMFSKTLLIFYGILLVLMITITIMSAMDIRVNFDIKWKNNNAANLVK